MSIPQQHQSRAPTPAQELLEERLQSILAGDDWNACRPLVQKLAAALQLDIIDCAAALAYLVLQQKTPAVPKHNPRRAAPEIKMVRYRIEVGRKHHATEDAIKTLLIAETGVESRFLRHIDLRHDHTLMQLPEGMPGEIYQHLQTVLFNQQPLRIKRLDGKLREHPAKPKNFRADRRRVRHRVGKEQPERASKREHAPPQMD